jgi:cobalt-zinc-cadmium efflux system outer membrane protein
MYIELSLALAAMQAAGPQDTVRLTLDAATRRAEAVSPQLAAASGAVRQPRGVRAETWWPFPTNPLLEYGRVRRRTGPTTAYDRQWSLTQEVEIAGQGFVRARGADARIRAALERVGDAKRLVGLEVRQAYASLAVAERRAALTDSAARFAERLAVVAEQQATAGEINRIERNVAVLDAARARSTADRTRAQVAVAAADLARLLALPRDSMPQTVPLPAIPNLRWPSDSVLVSLARLRRPDLRAQSEALAGAERTVSAERLGIVPNLTLSTFNGREAGTDDLLGVAIGLSVPLFHRQQGALGAAEAERSAARAERTAGQRSVEAEALAAGARFTRAREAERQFAGGVLQSASENVALTERALAEGEVSVTDVLLLRSTSVGAQLEYLEVLHDSLDAWFALAAALAAEPSELEALLARGA